MPRGPSAPAGGTPVSDVRGSFKRRKRKSVVVTAMLLIVSVLILVFGLAATTKTQNITVGGYYPGVILGFGSFLGIIGAHLTENKRQMLVASIIFISFGVVAAFCCAIVDGIFAARHIDLGPLYAGRCDYYSSLDSGELHVHCQTASHMSCDLRVKSNTCYCCELYNCGNRVDLRGGYHEYTEVRSCQDVVHLYHLLWSATILNIIALFLGIVTAAVLGGFKDMVTCDPPMPAAAPDACEPVPVAAPTPPDIPANSNYFYNTAPCLPPYTAYDLQGSGTVPDSSGLSDISQSGASHVWPTMIPPRYSPAYYPPDDKPPPYSP
ncbi:transmembrane protein 255A isoform X2 [Brachyhypopomus gauderio]|uniref:transmembrane protein 255A isoform X2 n=1 Tax=Brachyhypopomus gauderio TaxID=698409 RepID=UPI004041A7E1